MADIADITADRQELEDEIRRQYLPTAEGPKPNGACHNCGEPLQEGARFCDNACRDDWQAREKMKRITGK